MTGRIRIRNILAFINLQKNTSYKSNTEREREFTMAILAYAYCCSLNEKNPNRLILLSNWSPMGETLWEVCGLVGRYVSLKAGIEVSNDS